MAPHTPSPETGRNSAAIPRGAYFALFAVSGFAGLIYESIWSHYLKLFLGHAAYAQTLVLAMFMGGMAIGAWLCSRVSSRWGNLLRGYAIAEGLVGVAALAFHPVFVGTTDLAYDSILPAIGGETGAALAKWIIATLLILPQSILLGMTFPLMSAGLLRRYPSSPGESLSLLYFTNSLGAAIGVLVSGFVLIEKLGLPGTMQFAGLINLALAAVVFLLARGREETMTGEARLPATENAETPYHLLLLIALLTGAASFIYEIGWIRMLSLVLGSSTHSFELMLSSFILGLAFGGLWIRKRIDSIADPLRFLGMVQLAMGMLALATLPLYGQMFGVMQAVMKGLARTESGYAMFLLSSDGIALAIMFPATFCAGMTLPLITYALLRGGHGEKSIGAVYSANTLGAILGVFVAAHAGMPLLGLKGLITAGALIDVALGLALIWRVRAGTGFKVGTAAAAAACFAAAIGLVQFDNYKMASGVFRRGDVYSDKEAKLVFHRDGKTATVSLMDFPEGRSLRTNGKSDGAINLSPGARISDEITMTLTAALPLAYKPDAKRVAVIGLGTGITTHTMLARQTLESVETIEIEPAIAEASRGFMPRNANAYADPRSHIVFDDAKTYFSTHNRKYDIIVSEPSNPWVSGVSSLFTGEFYRHVRRYLSPGGVLVQWFQLYEIDISLVASVMVALGENFPDYAVYAATSGDMLIVAGDRETLARPLADVTAMPGVSAELSLVHVHTLGDLQIRRIGGKATLAPLFASYQSPANSDFHPFLDQNAARYRFMQQTAGTITELGAVGIPVVALLERRGAQAGTVEPSMEGYDYLEKLDYARRAMYARDFFLRPQPPQPVNMPRQFQKDLEITRMRVLDCREPERYDIWFHSLYQVARQVMPLLSIADSAALWRRFEQSPCHAALPEVQRQWMALFKAVGTHDATNMAPLAEALLATTHELPSGHRQYLVAAGMAAHLARGDRAAAAALWNRAAGDVAGTTDLALRLLHAHAVLPARQ